MSFKSVLSQRHKECDVSYAGIETAAHRGDWAAAMRAFDAFVSQTEHHFHYEENVLFPALELAKPMTRQPTTVMRAEHEQIRDLAGDLRAAIEGREIELLSGSLETLMFLLQQHNAKEENILYPLADQTLSPDLLTGHSGR